MQPPFPGYWFAVQSTYITNRHVQLQAKFLLTHDQGLETPREASCFEAEFETLLTGGDRGRLAEVGVRFCFFSMCVFVFIVAWLYGIMGVMDIESL